MAEVKLTWNASPENEQVSGYRVYQDGLPAGTIGLPEFVIPDVAPGVHSYEVAALNIWGEGPKSDPVSTPAVPGKVSGVQISININVTVAA